MKLPDSNKLISIAIFIGIVVALFIVYKILGATGLVKTSAKKKEIAEENAAIDTVRTADIFDPTYYFKFEGKFKSLGNNKITQMSNELFKALVGPGTDEERIYIVFGNIYNKLNVSELAAGYKYKFNRDLRLDLLGDLSKRDMATLMALINKLPNN